MSIAGGHHNAVDAALKIGFDTVQIFTKGNQQWNAPPLTDDAAKTFREAVTNAGLGQPVGHTSYLINLASPDNLTRSKSINALVDELQRGEALGLSDLVLHPGAHMKEGVQAGIRRIVDGLDQVFRSTQGFSLRVALETTAGQGSSIGCELEHLEAIIAGVQEPERLSVCVDTCHIFAAGYALDPEQSYDDWVEKLEKTVGIKRVALWHVNDSMKPFGSRVDRHAGIGRGMIPAGVFERILNDTRFENCPMILETPKGEEDGQDLDAINLEALRRLLR
jgi:deoxyribonuclease-4